MDDGAKTVEDSLAMLQIAVESGTTDLVASPHANSSYTYDPQMIQQQIKDLNQSMQGKVRLYQGCDFHLSFDNIEDAVKNPRKYTINGHRYLLVEFSDLLIFHNTAQIFDRLQAARMVPIITHPERNSLLRQRIDSIAEWVANGALVQVTAGSLLGNFGKRASDFSRQLLDRNLVHFIASDAHDVKFRTPSMKEAFAWLSQHCGEAYAQALCVDNPRATLTDGDVELPSRDHRTTQRQWYQFWR
jgi:protein-tyrosine phosphatase